MAVTLRRRIGDLEVWLNSFYASAVEGDECWARGFRSFNSSTLWIGDWVCPGPWGASLLSLDFDYITFLSRSSISWHTSSSNWRQVSPAVSDPLILRSLQNRTNEFKVSDIVPWSDWRIWEGGTRLIPLHKLTMRYRLKLSVIAKVCQKKTCRWNGCIWPAGLLSLPYCHVIAPVLDIMLAGLLSARWLAC